MALPGPGRGRPGRAGRHRPLLHPAGGGHAHRGAQRPRLDGTAAEAGRRRGHQRGHLRHRRARLGPRGVRQPGLDRGHRPGPHRRPPGGDGRQRQVRDRLVRPDGGEPQRLDRGPGGLHRGEVPRRRDRRHRLRGRGPGRGDPDGDRPHERQPRPHRPGRRVHVVGTRRGPGHPGRRQDRAGLLGGPRHPAVDAPVPDRRLVQRQHPLGRREPRLPDRVGRRAAGQRGGVPGDERGQRRPARGGVRRQHQGAAARARAAHHEENAGDFDY